MYSFRLPNDGKIFYYDINVSYFHIYFDFKAKKVLWRINNMYISSYLVLDKRFIK